MSKTKVKRIPKRGHYDFETIAAVLDEDFICQVALKKALALKGK